MKVTKSLFLLVLLFIFSSCEDGLNCIIPKAPELSNKSFPIASTENYYYVDLTAEINNEPRDDDYDYFFNVDGLPLGMDYFVNFRTISIEGTPEEVGTFDIVINLYVEGPFRPNVNEEPDLLCDYETSKTYTLIVE